MQIRIGGFMKSLAELQALRDEMQNKIGMRKENTSGIKVLVGMATCGIAAGARPVLQALLEEIGKRKLSDVSVTQTGCIGICQYEPVVEVVEPGKEKITYVNVSPDMVPAIVSQHLVNGNPVVNYTIGAATT